MIQWLARRLGDGALRQLVEGLTVLWLITFGLAGLAFYGQSREAHHRCLDSQRNRAAIRAIVMRSDKSLDDPKAPGHSYWQAHPDERVAQHASNKKILAHYLPEIHCP